MHPPAALQGKTIKQYALERLFPGDADANQAWDELRALLDTRIHAGLTGHVSAKSISEIVDEELTTGRLRPYCCGMNRMT